MRAPSLVIAILGVGCGRLFGISDVPGVSDANDAAATESPSGAARRKPITIQGAMITGAETDFPVWIALSDSDIAAHARADGSDIYFTDGTGAALDHEIQSWVAPNLSAWVRVPLLAKGADTTIYVTYGASTVAPDPPGVFKSGFAAVWHLDDSLATSTIAEATGTHPGQAVGLTTGAAATGELGRGIAFDGSGVGAITFVNPLTGNAPHTISAWVNQLPATHTSAIVTVGTPTTDRSRLLYGRYGNSATMAVGYFNDDLIANHDLEAASWKLVHWIFEGTNRVNHIYVDGAEITGSPMTMVGAANTAGTAGIIGFAPEPDYGANNGFAGILDEVRIATVARDASWIRMEFANQASPQTFYAIGPEEVAQ